MENPESLEMLRSRLDRQGRDFRLACRIGVVLLLAPAAFLSRFGTGPPTRGVVVRAERLELRDRQGRLRALLGVDAEGVPRLALIDDRGHERVSLDAPGDGATATLSARGGARVVLATADGGSMLRVSTPAERDALDLFVHPGDPLGLSLRSEGVEGHLTMRPDGRGGLSAVAGPAPGPTNIPGLP